MKRFLLLLVLLFVFQGCEDVIEVDVPSDPPRLVVNGLLRVDIDEPFIPVRIRVTTTNNFFEEIPVASLESIIIILQELDEEGTVISTGTSSLAEETPGSGIYIPDPTFDDDQRIPTSATASNILYTLVINHEGRRYAAQTRYVPAVPIDSIEQGSETLFSDEDTEVIITYTDNPDRTDYYIFDFDFGEFFASEDTFYQGQQFSFSYFYDQQFDPGTELEISILGADQALYNYMNLLVEQSNVDFNVFQTPVATVRGNVFDVTDLDNINVVDNVAQPEIFPLGYFAIVQEYKATLVIE